MTEAPAVLLDNHPVRRAALGDSLRNTGQPVIAVDGPKAAVQALEQAEPSLLVLDLTVPGLDLAVLREAICAEQPGAPDSLEAAERRHIARVLEFTGGNKRETAHLLGIARSTLLAKLRKYRLYRSAGEK